ncbi:hypothetical protein PLICRDRAFT_90152, partial [Plicaturopsis crispa FD-325 SS-3]
MDSGCRMRLLPARGWLSCIVVSQKCSRTLTDTLVLRERAQPDARAVASAYAAFQAWPTPRTQPFVSSMDRTPSHTRKPLLGLVALSSKLAPSFAWCLLLFLIWCLMCMAAVKSCSPL